MAAAALSSTPRRHAPLWLLALVTFSGTLAMHIFVPALPVAAQGLGAGMGAMQMTVSLYILGLAVGQLAYGPLADRYGRRPVLLCGLALYSAAGLAAALAPDVHASPRGCSRPWAAARGWCWGAAWCATPPSRRKPRSASRS